MSTDEPVDGVALCLSGGGYRAMLFHVGVVWRLHDAGWLTRLDRVSSVSGGSITAGALALAWPRLEAEGLEAGLRRARCARWPAARRRHVGDRRRAHPDTISERVAKAYRRHLFGDATLQDLPDHPRFVINATSVQSGALFRFSKPYMADWRVGRVDDPEVPLADAVAASSRVPARPLPLRARPATTRRGSTRTATTSATASTASARSSPTAASTTTSGSRRPGRRPHDARLRRRRPDGARARPRPRLGPPPVPRARRDRQPGPHLRKRQCVGRVQGRRAARGLLGHPHRHRRLRPRRRAAGAARRRRSPSRRSRPGSRGSTTSSRSASSTGATRRPTSGCAPTSTRRCAPPGGYPYPAAGVGP